MDWVQTFYARQDEWAGIYSGPIAASDRARAASVARLAGDGQKRILELGAGGGQTAAALANAGHSVTAIELVPAAAQHARALAALPHAGPLVIVEADFYTAPVDGPFDVVCYWDGFGIGSDADQRRLVARIAAWLAPHGCALIDIYTPWYWTVAAGRHMQVGRAMRRYDFDAMGCRLLDRWWPAAAEEQAISQSLRCYSPADLNLLLEGTGMHLAALEPGGAVDYDAQQYRERVPLGQAMQYLVKLIPDAPIR